MRSDRLTVFGTSAVIHAIIAALLAWLAVDQVTKSEPEPVFIELDLPRPTRALPEAPQPKPLPVTPPPPAASTRPAVIPDKTRVVQVEKPAPFAPEILESGTREAPDDVLAVDRPTTTHTFDMEQNVGGGSGDYVSNAVGGSVPVAPGGRGGRGGGGGAPGTVNRGGRTDLQVARDWQVTVLPKPLNDRDFEPDYPTLAKREGREAVVILELSIDAKGRVARAEVLKGPRGRGFRRAAKAYARKLRFEPALAGTRPVAARIEWTVYFYVRN